MIDATPGLRHLDRLGRRPDVPVGPGHVPARATARSASRGQRLEVDAATDLAVLGRDLVAGVGEAIGEVVEGAPPLAAAHHDRADVGLGGRLGDRLAA